MTGVEDPDTRAHGANEGLHLAEFERVCSPRRCSSATSEDARAVTPVEQVTRGQWAGTLTVNVLPTPSSDSTSIRPR